MMAVTEVPNSSKERPPLEELRIEANGNLGPIDSSRIPRYAGAA
ncbi:MAG TPA: agmatinase, partial [Arthrobacter sp.]|nr:agmatinase [Arthrobacter sp.]